MSKIESFKDLIVYQKAYKLAMEIFELSRGFPKEEKYSLTDQIRRSIKICYVKPRRSMGKTDVMKNHL